jgi:hypothetical protein
MLFPTFGKYVKEDASLQNGYVMWPVQAALREKVALSWRKTFDTKVQFLLGLGLCDLSASSVVLF